MNSETYLAPYIAMISEDLELDTNYTITSITRSEGYDGNLRLEGSSEDELDIMY